jgi:hypothetical protein
MGSDWDATLETNSCGRRILTLPAAREMAARGEMSGWYVAPFATVWTVGRESTEERYHILDADGEPITFASPEAAQAFVNGLLPPEPKASPSRRALADLAQGALRMVLRQHRKGMLARL